MTALADAILYEVVYQMRKASETRMLRHRMMLKLQRELET